MALRDPNSDAPCPPDEGWYEVEVGCDPAVLDEHAERLQLLYPGRYETRICAKPKAGGNGNGNANGKEGGSRYKLSVRHRS